MYTLTVTQTRNSLNTEWYNQELSHGAWAEFNEYFETVPDSTDPEKQITVTKTKVSRPATILSQDKLIKTRLIKYII